MLPVDTLYVAIYDAASESYEVPLFYDLGEYRTLDRVACRVTPSLTGAVIQMRHSLYIPDIRDPEAMRSYTPVKVANAPTATYLGVPMMIRGRVVGVISIQSLLVDAYNPDQVRFLETIAMQAAVAVENAQLYEAAQRELTERRQVEEQLRVAVTKYAVLFNTAPVGISITDEAGLIIESNPEAERILGITQREHQQRNYAGPEWEIVRPDGTPMAASEYASVRAFTEQRRIDGVEMGIVHPNDSMRWITVNAAPIPLDGYGVAIVYNDITERKEIDDQLHQKEYRYRLLADNVRDAVWASDLQGQLTYVSSSIERLWGYVREDFAGNPEGVAVSPAVMEAARLRARRLMRAAGDNQPTPVERYDLPLRRKDGTELILDVLASPLVDEDGKVVGILNTGRDVTEARSMAAEIRSLNATLEQRVAERTAELSAALEQLTLADRMKDEFLAAVSHELRTPLSGILGAADVLAMEMRGPLNDYQKHQITTVLESGARLLKLVNDLLRYASLTAGKTTLACERCSLAEVGSATIQRAAGAAERKRQEIAFAVMPPDLAIISDSEALMNMLDALLDNAVKFTPAHGHIGLEIQAVGDDRVRFVVSDDGIGIDAEKQKRIFLPFVQGDGALNRAYDGTGLGLAFVARMANALGGTVGVESVPTRGSRFFITLPTIL